MSTTLRYRQNVADFRNRLNDILNGAGPASGRTRINTTTTGSRITVVPSTDLEHRMILYGQRRHHSAARIMALFEIARITENLHTRANPVTTTPQGAVWQAFGGTTANNACHTCPCHLQLDGNLPTLITTNRGLQRYLVLEFADCMLMPRSINEVDMVVDDGIGKVAFANAAALVLNNANAGWRQGLDRFKSQMRELLGPVGVMMQQARGNSHQIQDERIHALCGFYEGLFYQRESNLQMDNFIAQVTREMNIS
jgi:hypothetical protein